MSSCTTPVRSPRKRTLSVRESVTPSDNERLEIRRKRFRHEGFDAGSPSTSRKSPRIRDKDSGQSPTIDLEEILRRCAKARFYDDIAFSDLRGIPKDDQDIMLKVRVIIRKVQASVKECADSKGEKILETELYLMWLQGFQFVLDAILSALGAKIPGTKRRLSGFGWISFSILYHLMDEFVSEIEGHHDGWSYHSSGAEPSLYPNTMTLVEESNNPLTDIRSENAVHSAEEFLKKFDNVMEEALRRYKAESGKSKKQQYEIGRKEDALAKACCLLCEQTGYGGEDDEMGDTLLQNTRSRMRQWRDEV